MAVLEWDGVGDRKYETGVDRGVLYIPNQFGVYNDGVAWNGLVSVSEAPTGAEANAQYADNVKYLNLFSAEEFGATIEAFTYPDEFAPFDGLNVDTPGVAIGQQARKSFGLSYRTKLGNDVEGDDYGYKLHLIYGCSASPSEKAYTTINDSPEAITFSWELTTIPVAVPGMRPSSVITIDSTAVQAADLLELENLLWGTAGQDPSLPLPEAVIAIFSGAQTSVMAQNPTFTAATGAIVIPAVTGVRYFRADTNATVTGTVTIPTAGATWIIKAEPSSTAYLLSPDSDDSWSFTRNP
jgi:hypothetical protein